jgi:Flp pilus assembly pilin Flp
MAAEARVSRPGFKSFVKKHWQPIHRWTQTGDLGTNMMFLRNFWNDEQGQDLIEYTLLLAFVALASAALFIGAGGSVKGIWSVTNSQLAVASTKAS